MLGRKLMWRTLKGWEWEKKRAVLENWSSFFFFFKSCLSSKILISLYHVAFQITIIFTRSNYEWMLINVIFNELFLLFLWIIFYVYILFL